MAAFSLLRGGEELPLDQIDDDARVKLHCAARIPFLDLAVVKFLFVMGKRLFLAAAARKANNANDAAVCNLELSLISTTL